MDQGTIGVSSVFETSQFRAGLGQYLDGLTQANKATENYVDKAGRLRDAEGKFVATGKAAQSASKGIGELANAAASGAGGVSGFASAIGGVLTTAGGIIAADVFGKMVRGIGDFVAMGVNAVGTYQQIEMGLNALLTSSNMYKQVTSEVTSVVTNQLMTDAEYAQRLDELNARLAVQNSSLQEHKERIRQLTEQYGENGLVVIKARDQLNQMQVAIRGTEQDIAGLTKSTTSYSTETVSSYEKVMDFADAQKAAAKQADELLGFVDELSVVSPFEQSQVALVTKLAAAANLGVEDIKSFTSGFLDLAAGVGIGSESLAFAADQLLQVQKVGKLNMIDVRQLRRLGINLDQIIGVQMGMTIDEFNEKAATTPEIFNELFTAVSDFSKNTFAGTAKKMATSVSGLQSTISDIFTVSSRKLLQPLVEAASPMAADLLGMISDVVLGPETEKIGQGLAKGIFGVFRVLSGDDLGVTDLIQSAVGFGADASTAANIGMIASSILDLSSGFAVLMQTGQGGDLMTALGISTEAQATIMGVINSLNSALEQVQSGQGGDLITSWATQLISSIPTALGSLVETASSFLSDQWPTIHGKLLEWADKFWDWSAEAASGAGQFMIGIGAALLVWASSPEASTQMASIGQSIGATIMRGVSSTSENSDEMAMVVTNLVGGLAVGVLAVAGSLILLGGQILANIIAGVIQKATGSEWKVQTLGEFKQMAANIAAVDWGEVGTGLMDLIGRSLADGAAAIGETLTTSAKAWADIVTDTPWADVGKNIVSGILKGLSNNVSKVYEKIKEMASKAISEAMASWGIHSPSTEFAWLTEMAMKGAVEGVDDNQEKLHKAIQSAFNIDYNVIGMDRLITKAARGMKEAIPSNVADSKAHWIQRVFTDILKNNSEAILGATNRKKAFMSVLRANGVALSKIGVSDSEAVQERAVSGFLRGFDEVLAKAKITLMQSIKDGTVKMIESGNSLIDMAQSAAGVLDSQVDILTQGLVRGWDEIGLGGQIYSAADAQALLNDKVAEQLGMQQDLAQLAESQSKLDLLKKQIDLLDTVKNAGLDVNEFFNGISLGKDASASDIVEATNRVVQMLISEAAGNLSLLAPGASGTGTSLFGNARQSDFPVINNQSTASTYSDSSRIINLSLGDVYVSGNDGVANLREQITSVVNEVI